LIGGEEDTHHLGAAWVFTRSEGKWKQQGPKLTGGIEETGNASFGVSVALSSDGSIALIGAYHDNSSVGAAWAFKRSETGKWSQQGFKLTGSGESGEGAFGTAVALSADGRTALIGGWADEKQAGAAWEFTRPGGTWRQSGSKLVGKEQSNEAHSASAWHWQPTAKQA
jgi:hypothetical protein